MDNQQPSSFTGEGSTTIPQGSTYSKRAIRKKAIYLKTRNVIYKITNKVNNKIYIGSASYYDKRIGTHVNRLNSNIHDNNHLQAAWNKYGKDNFEFSIIEECTKDNLLIKEQYWLDLTQCYIPSKGYNIDKIAGSRIGGSMPQEARVRIGNFWRGKKLSKERVERIRFNATQLQGKAVIAIRLSDNKQKEFPSLSAASRELKVSIAAISKQCGHNLNPLNTTKRRKDSFYHFRYKDIV